MKANKAEIEVWSTTSGRYNFYSFTVYINQSEILFSHSSLFSVYGNNDFACYGGILKALEMCSKYKIKNVVLLLSNYTGLAKYCGRICNG